MTRIAFLSNAVICIALLFGFNPGLAQTNFWQQTKGPTGATITAFAIDGQGNLWAGTDGDGIFRSTDHGETWVYSGLTDILIYALAIDTLGNIFAGRKSIRASKT